MARSTTRNGRTVKPFDPQRSGQNAHSSNFSQILDRFSGSSDVADFLNALGITQTGDLTGSQRTDWNKQLLDTLTNYKLTAENRAYNEGLRDEQRVYDSPMAQLARLMGAGISRDQAIQMLGSGSGSGGSAGVPYSDAVQAEEGIAPSESRLNAVQATQAKLQSALGFVGAVSGLMSLGFSAAQAVPQIKMLKNSAYMSDKQRQAFDDAGTAFRLVTKGGKVTKDTFGSINSVADSINTLAQGGDFAAKAFVDDGGLDRLRQNSPYSLPFLNQLYKNEKEPEYYTRQIESALRLQDAQSNLNEVNADKALVEIDEVNSKIANLDADTEYKEGLKNLLHWQTENIKADTALKNEEANGIKLDNNVKKNFQETSIDGTTGLQLFTDESIARLRRSLMSVNAEIGSKVWEQQINTVLADQRNLQQLYTLQYLYNKGEFDAVSNTTPLFQQFLYLNRAADSCGVFDYVNAMSNSNTAGTFEYNLGIIKGRFQGRDHRATLPLFQLRANSAYGVLFGE